MKIFSSILHVIIFIILSVVTQIGGLIWVISVYFSASIPAPQRKYAKFFTFPTFYLIATFLIVPLIAPHFGRTPLPKSKSSKLAPHSYWTIILNRHYVTHTLKNELHTIASQYESQFPQLKTIYLDANFPFWDGFPLLPHLSHNDGKKIDLSFIYETNGAVTNSKPSRSGYGHYESPKPGEYNQPSICLRSGYWQYDFPKYLTLGVKPNFNFESGKTKKLIQLILSRKNTHKVFLEPHLSNRLGLKHKKLRFHGCRAVRHDDHIHYQVK
ncbi:MAG: hypothetical protein P1U56_18545 [Saprospiraceae bacterium]|nr:hypothetical protein [Saprospiraceae bacterium]